MRDFSGRFQHPKGSASYVGEDGKKHRPVMMHRAILGSFERFIGILIDNMMDLSLYGYPHSCSCHECIKLSNRVTEITEILKKNEIKVISDLRMRKSLIKSTTLYKMQIVIGDKEVEEDSISVRDRESKTIFNVRVTSQKWFEIRSKEV